METVWKPLARMLAFSRAIGKLLLPGRRPVSFLLEHDRGSEDHYRHLTGEQAGAASTNEGAHGAEIHGRGSKLYRGHGDAQLMPAAATAIPQPAVLNSRL